MKFLFACGGTAGHIYPAVAVAGKLAERYPDSEFLFIGANGKMEMELVPKEGYAIRGVDITNISRGKNLAAVKHNMKTLRNVFRSRRDARAIIRSFAPDAVIGTGGYVCFPVLRAAASMGIPTLVHESNAVPGLTTKMLSGNVDRILVGFEDSVAHYKKKERVAVTGTPVRGAFDSYTREQARRELGIAPEEKLVLSVWGSLGSGHMNTVIPQMLPQMNKGEFRLVHVTGKSYHKQVMANLEKAGTDPAAHGAEIREYLFDMPRWMAAADLILCRSGASTLAELTYMGMPAILVPSPNVTNNHQEKNARVLERAGGAKVFVEGSFDAASLLDTVRTLLEDKEGLDTMRQSMRSLAVSDAADVITDAVLSLCTK